MKIIRNRIPREVFKFILEQNSRGVRHKRIAEMVEDKFKYPVNQKEIGKLIRAANGLDESSQYEVE